jgi:hypothetical protein
MKIFLAIKSGFIRSVTAWKGILVVWFISLAMVSMIVVPLKTSLNSAIGSSMVTEKFMKGINFDVMGDLLKNMSSLSPSLFSGFITLSLLSILVNAFITGGLFDALKKGTEKFSSEKFFSSSAKNFWPFLLISVILYLILIFLFIIVIVIPVAFAANADPVPEGSVFIAFCITLPVFMAGATMIYLVADYARACQVSQLHKASFKALGYGFNQTFRTFNTSFPLVIIMLLFQILPAWAMIKIIAGYTPSISGGIFLLFTASQLLLLLKMFFKVLRYGSITSLMELNQISVSPLTENKLTSAPENFTDFTMEIKQRTYVR